MLKNNDFIPSVEFSLNVITRIAKEIASDVQMNTRLANEKERMCIPIFDNHMKRIASGYAYEPTIYFIFSRNDDGQWILHKSMFYLWFKKNVPTFKKLSNVSNEFKSAVSDFENMNSYVMKYKELFKNGKGEYLDSDDVVREADLLWSEYKAQQLQLALV